VDNPEATRHDLPRLPHTAAVHRRDLQPCDSVRPRGSTAPARSEPRLGTTEQGFRAGAAGVFLEAPVTLLVVDRRREPLVIRPDLLQDGRVAADWAAGRRPTWSCE